QSHWTLSEHKTLSISWSHYHVKDNKTTQICFSFHSTAEHLLSQYVSTERCRVRVEYRAADCGGR
ncbi:hypothetical protein ACNH62_005057, partial [Escherichia coli]